MQDIKTLSATLAPNLYFSELAPGEQPGRPSMVIVKENLGF